MIIPSAGKSIAGDDSSASQEHIAAGIPRCTSELQTHRATATPRNRAEQSTVDEYL